LNYFDPLAPPRPRSSAKGDFSLKQQGLETETSRLLFRTHTRAYGTTPRWRTSTCDTTWWVPPRFLSTRPRRPAAVDRRVGAATNPKHC